MLIPISPLEYRGLHKIPALPRFTIESMGLGALEDLVAPWAGQQFREDFLGFAEDPTEASVIRESFLTMDAHDFKTDRTCGILDELGGSLWAPIRLSQFWYMLGVFGRQRQYSAYIRKGSAVLNVSARWVFKGRQTLVQSVYIESSPINKPYVQGAGCHVLSQ